MILTVVLAALAGWGAKQVEDRVSEMLLQVLGPDNMISDQDRSVAALLLCLLVAAFVLSLLGFGGHVFLFVVAAILGFFQEEIREAVLNRRA